jgi:hypothetical protein
LYKIGVILEFVKPIVGLKNTDHFERYVSGIFDKNKKRCDI